MYQFLNTGNSFKAASSNVKHCEPTQYWKCFQSQNLSFALPLASLQTPSEDIGRNMSWVTSSLHCEEGTEGNWKLQNIHHLYGRAEDFRVNKPRVSYVNSHLFKKLLSSLYLFYFIVPFPEKISFFHSNFFFLHPIKFPYLSGTSDTFPKKVNNL